MRIEFEVEGRPPMKRGEKSMWSRADLAPRVALLRERALAARAREGIDDYFNTFVALDLTIYVPRGEIEQVGDLDNFITGVCDGLQKADAKVLPHLHQIFSEPGKEAINPRVPILIENDSKVLSITAKKVSQDDAIGVTYVVGVGPLDS